MIQLLRLSAAALVSASAAQAGGMTHAQGSLPFWQATISAVL
tara:strand:+ start:229 stop:354 length:126 start_codon:yes stop_codon:yes gene_type:complete